MKITAIYWRPPAQTIPPGAMAAWHRWVASRPLCVQALIADFPPGTEIETDEGYFFLAGYTEDDRLIVSLLAPYVDRNAAMALKQYICAAHLRDAPCYAPPVARPRPPQAIADKTIRVDN